MPLRSTSGNQMFGTLMILKATCMQNASYIDRLITSFMRVLERMAKEHLTPTSGVATNPSECSSVRCYVCAFVNMCACVRAYVRTCVCVFVCVCVCVP